MKVSWRNIGEDQNVFAHYHNFVAGELHQGKNPMDFILWLIRFTPAVGVAVNDKPVWKSTEYRNVEKLIADALAGEPRNASILMTIDYNVEGDWIDSECRGCGGLFGTHSHCPTLSAIDKGWSDVVAWADGR